MLIYLWVNGSPMVIENCWKICSGKDNITEDDTMLAALLE
jgi:hypothetical protein